ncbi:DNA internalization-related competence protein ComEC/Rec2 [Parashewanella tropica]|uniref:DNA internalization-related competence protein ComEC/Rec2 n=1 Tax=Parashewanella tropica TaxID=2547970 RepID=UPI0010598F6D|nr:DNA internalization-related competence protein ComEC/Rec2 [Parashewanella tropica]
MNRFMSGYCATSLSAIFWPSLLPYEFLIPGVVIALITLYLRNYILLGAICAALWLSCFTELLLNYQYDPKSKRISTRAEIISLVSQNSDFLSADIRLIKPSLISYPQQYLRVYWRTDQKIEVGEQYIFNLKPKSVTSVANEGGFNQQKNLLSKHIIGKANVVEAKLLKNTNSLRASLLSRLTKQTESLSNRDLLLALLVGERKDFSEQRWQALRSSGTGHLVAISGLHLSVISVWCFLLCMIVLSWLTPSQGLRNLRVAIVVTCVCASFYAYLAGFAIATQRALLMLLVVMALTSWHKVSSPWERLLIALFVVLVIDPLAILGAGLWLSFGALSIILLCISRFKMVDELHDLKGVISKLRMFVVIQLGLSLGLGMIGSLFFGGFSIHSIWVNLIAVPWFSIVVIPCAFLSFIVWWIGESLGYDFGFGLQLTNWFLQPFSVMADQVVYLPLSWVNISPTLVRTSVYLVFAIALFYLVAPRRKYFWSVILSLPFVLQIFSMSWKNHAEWKMHVLDVGQGLAIVIEKQGRALIYDTGAKYGQNFSYAKTVILPFLDAKGLTQIDYIIVSHGDNDHAGGLNVVQKNYPAAKLMGNVEGTDSPCNIKDITWQQLSIEVLWPLKPEKGNNGSCVVRISDSNSNLLLAGDIEKAAEYSLVNMKVLTKSEVLVVPHHGSRTSSTHEFIHQVHPQLAIFAAGFRNRYGFPKQEVVKRYEHVGADMLQTGIEGQITVVFSANDIKTRTYRQTIAPYWYNQLFNFGEFR